MREGWVNPRPKPMDANSANEKKRYLMDKNTLRGQMLQLRSQLRPKFMETSGKRIGGQLAALSVFQNARTVMLYHSYHNEADTQPLLRYCLKVKKRVVLPVTDDEFILHPYEISDLGHLRTDARGIAEPDPEFCIPVDPLSIDLAVVPGLAFDTGGGRIGYGKGCYDKFLPLLRADVPVIALAYDFQVLPRVVQAEYDRKMDLIVTEKGILPVAGGKIRL